MSCVVNKGCLWLICDTGLIVLGEPGCDVPRRVLDRFGNMITSVIALHHAITSVAACYRTGVCTVNVPRCRKLGICDTSVVNNVAYDNGLVVLRVHHDTTYFVQSCHFFSHRVASAIALHHAKTDNEIPK